LKAVVASADPRERTKRARRTWPDDEKQRMVAEALSPGASVAAIARRHGINANLLFNWVRSARKLSLAAASSGPASAACLAPEPPAPLFSGDFIQLGVVADAPGIGPALIARAEPGEPTKLSSGQAATATEAKTRPGLIEIELANGTRLRVDAFVNERALHRVMSVLKATS
jgi:transposase